MGLDWLLKAKVKDGTEVSPMEELGAIRLDGANPLAVEAFRRIYESHQEGAATRLKENAADAYGLYWTRPFDEVLAEAAKDRPVLGNTLPDPLPADLAAGLPEFGASFLCGPVDFRGKAVAYCSCLPEELQNRAFDDMEPAEMVEFAHEIEAVLARSPTADPEERSILQAAVKWLTFWGNRSFGLDAWY